MSDTPTEPEAIQVPEGEPVEEPDPVTDPVDQSGLGGQAPTDEDPLPPVDYPGQAGDRQ